MYPEKKSFWLSFFQSEILKISLSLQYCGFKWDFKKAHFEKKNAFEWPCDILMIYTFEEDIIIILIAKKSRKKLQPQHYEIFANTILATTSCIIVQKRF